MAEIYMFTPRADLEAAENVTAFIAMAKDKLTVFGKDLDWASNNWDVTKFVNRPGIKTRQCFCFSTFDSSGNRTNWTPMAEPFLSFAKALMRYDFGRSKRESHNPKLAAIRALEKALVAMSADSIPKAEDITPHTLNKAADYLQSTNPASAFNSGCHLEIIARFLNENQMVKAKFQWRNIIQREEDINIRIGAEADAKKKAKLPSMAAIRTIPQIFDSATDPRDIVISSIAGILFSSPDRFNEVFRLPSDCERNPETTNGTVSYGLSWDSSKGADATVKRILPSMTQVCKEAIKKLRIQTDEARRIASWYEKHPNQLYLPDGFEHYRSYEYLQADDLALLIGQANSSKACRWANENGLVPIKVPNKTGKGAPANAYLFADIERVIVKMLPHDFPLYDQRTGITYSEALLLVPLNFFHAGRGTWRCMFQTISINCFNDQIGSAVEHGKSSIFSRNNFTENDGTPISVSSHDFRHYLNYLAQVKNVDQLTIALWSTRKSVAQNRNYNQTTTEEKRTLLAQSGVATMDSLALVGLNINDPITPLAFESRKEILELESQTVHETRYGFCVHCYTMLPCFRQRACLDCNEHICIKGDEEKTANIKHNLQVAKEALERDQKAIDEGILGADEWFKFNEKRVARLTELVAHLDDPNLPAGSRIQLVSGVYSPIEIAVEDRRLLGDKDGKWLNIVSLPPKPATLALP